MVSVWTMYMGIISVLMQVMSVLLIDGAGNALWGLVLVGVQHDQLNLRPFKSLNSPS